MTTTVTSKGQVTIPKRVLEALNVKPGDAIEFELNQPGEAVLRKALSLRNARKYKPDRFDRLRGTARTKCRTDELMELLRR